MRGRALKIMVIVALVTAGAGWAGELEMSIALESQVVPVNGAVCGVVSFANAGGSAIEVAAPSMNLGNLWFEVDRDGVIQKIGSQQCLFTTGAKVSIDAGAVVSIPFYLLKNEEHYFTELGQCSIRAVLREGGPGAGPNEPLASSPWVRFDVIDHPLRELWRNECKHALSAYFPFDFRLHSGLPDELRRSQYYSTYALYQEFNPSVLPFPAGIPIIRERMIAIESQLKASSVGREMWKSFSEGKCVRKSTEPITGRVYAVWR